MLFYEMLEIPRGKDRAKNFLEREEFISRLLSGRFDFVLLNGIFMERVKNKLPLPAYYLTWARSYFEAFGGVMLWTRRLSRRLTGSATPLGKP
ncbi:hypothetical protein [Thermococcus peptonophilus]|uniref:hypothetical protein n=1 Tax=Thermococcus peptonophilus TaxID=53952 RepID=UPI003465F07B